MRTVAYRNHTKTPFAYLICALCVALIFWCADVFAAQPEYLSNEAPPPRSVKDVAETLSPQAIEKPPPRRGVFGWDRALVNLPQFFRDTSLILKPRLYNFDSNFSDGDESEAFAIGSAIEYRSGSWRNLLKVGLTGYTSQKLHGPRDKGGTGLLNPVQTGFGVLGEAYLNIDTGLGAEILLYRRGLHLPYLNRDNSRMVPLTHELYALTSGADTYPARWIAGHVTKMKQQDSNRFIAMSEAAGFVGTNEGVTLAGGIYNFTDNAHIGILNLYSWDFLNIFYAETANLYSLTDELLLRISGQVTSQASVGEELGGDTSTWTAGLRAALSYNNFVLSLAGTRTGDDSGITSPYGGSPSYLSLMFEDFDQAGEDAWLVGVAYTFTRLRAPGLSLGINYAQGFVDDSKVASGDETEFDATISFKPEFKWLRGLWFRARYATLNREFSRDSNETRLILNYEIPLL